MDIVERLRGHAKGNAGGVRELLVLSADEIERLRQQNAELKKQNAQTIKANEFLNYKLSEAIKEINKLDIAKATGGE